MGGSINERDQNNTPDGRCYLRSFLFILCLIALVITLGVVALFFYMAPISISILEEERSCWPEKPMFILYNIILGCLVYSLIAMVISWIFLKIHIKKEQQYNTATATTKTNTNTISDEENTNNHNHDENKSNHDDKPTTINNKPTNDKYFVISSLIQYSCALAVVLSIVTLIITSWYVVLEYNSRNVKCSHSEAIKTIMDYTYWFFYIIFIVTGGFTRFIFGF